MVVSILSVLDWKSLPFLGKFGPKNCSCQFKLKIGTWRIINNRIKNKYEEFSSNVHYFVFSTRSMLFFGNLFQKLKLLVKAEI